MAKKKMAPEQMATSRRTSVVIPEDLWLKAKMRAAEEHTDLRVLIIQGLVWATTTNPTIRSQYLLMNYNRKGAKELSSRVVD